MSNLEKYTILIIAVVLIFIATSLLAYSWYLFIKTMKSYTAYQRKIKEGASWLQYIDKLIYPAEQLLMVESKVEKPINNKEIKYTNYIKDIDFFYWNKLIKKSG